MSGTGKPVYGGTGNMVIDHKDQRIKGLEAEVKSLRENRAGDVNFYEDKVDKLEAENERLKECIKLLNDNAGLDLE